MGLMKAQPRNGFHVDYKNDTYGIDLNLDYMPRAHSITRSVSSSAFWLQYEYTRADDSPLRKVRRSGWFERRVAWVKELIDLMALSADEINAEMARLSEEGLALGTIQRESTGVLDFRE